jgi:hypothetical protein
VTSELTLTLQSTLVAYTLPNGTDRYFEKVFKGEPNALTPGARPVARWKVLRTQPAPEAARSVSGQRMIAMVFGVNAYWPLTSEEDAQQAMEDDIAVVLVDLPAKFIDPTLHGTDYTIAGKAVSLLTVENEQFVERTLPFPDAQRDVRALSFEVHARLLEAS